MTKLNLYMKFSLTHVTPSFNHASIQSSSVNIFGDDIIAITFKIDWDDKLKVSAIIEDALSLNLMMKLVMEEGGVFKDLDVPADGIEGYNVLIKKNSGNKLTLKWERFRNLAAKYFDSYF